VRQLQTGRSCDGCQRTRGEAVDVDGPSAAAPVRAAWRNSGSGWISCATKDDVKIRSDKRI
jgi:hypothetical protein